MSKPVRIQVTFEIIRPCALERPPVGATSETHPREVMRFGEVEVEMASHRFFVWWPIAKNADQVTAEDFREVCSAAAQTCIHPRRYSPEASAATWSSLGLSLWHQGLLLT